MIFGGYAADCKFGGLRELEDCLFFKIYRK